MKKYIKETKYNGYKNVLTVDENGNFYQYFEDINIHGQPFRFSEDSTTIYKMGWKSLSDFLKSRMTGYKVIIE